MTTISDISGADRLQVRQLAKRTYTCLLFPSLRDTNVRQYDLFPGIRLCLNRMYTGQMPLIPGPQGDRVIINYGLRGRSEQTLADGSVTFVAAGDLAISFQSVRHSFHFPAGIYEGVELYIDLEKAAGDSSLRAMGLDMTQLASLYGANGFFKSDHLPRVDALMKRIWETRGDDSDAELSLLSVSTLGFLQILLFEKIRETQYTNLSPENAACARAYRDALTENLSRRIPAREAAGKLHISETSLKNYFRIVYGENVSSYMRRCRMEKAAELLSSGGMHIGQIAAEVGFAGQNRFAAAFRSFYGMSPAEYRRSHRSQEQSGPSAEGS